VNHEGHEGSEVTKTAKATKNLFVAFVPFGFRAYVVGVMPQAILKFSNGTTRP
jgi:hypothetical protein